METLTAREKEALRLIVRGHDAKSMARELGLSVHTVNERLRNARRKLAVTSSREAARRLLEREGGPQSLGHEGFGAAPGAPDTQGKAGGAIGRQAVLAGVFAMSLLIFAIATLGTPHQAPEPTRANPPVVTSAPDAAVVEAARAFLLLVDAGRWQDSFDRTASAFRKVNTVAAWTSASQQARVPFGAVLSRALVSQDFVPAPPRGYAVVKFRTSYANKPDAIETVTLEREGADWRVAGIVIE